MVKKQELRWYGHISRSSGMAKTILQGTEKGARRRGRQKKRWEDNIKEWMGLGFGNSLRAAEDREGWTGIVATSSVVPQWPPRLRVWDEMRSGGIYNLQSFTEPSQCLHLRQECSWNSSLTGVYTEYFMIKSCAVRKQKQVSDAIIVCNKTDESMADNVRNFILYNFLCISVVVCQIKLSIDPLDN